MIPTQDPDCQRRPHARRPNFWFLAAALGSSLAGGAFAGSGTATTAPAFDVSWHSASGAGGGISGSCLFEVASSIGQPVVGPAQGGAFTVISGFLPDRDDADACGITDLDCSGMTDGGDLAIVVLNWGECACGAGCQGDIDWSGVVDGGDLSVVLLNWGE
jgi:hypothetical protein